MKILEINKFYYPKRGAERHFLDLIGLLESGDHEVAVFSMHSSRNIKSPWQKYFLSSVGYTKEHSLIEKIKGTFRMFYSFEAKRKIGAILDEFKPDIVHIHNIYHQLSPAILFEIKKREIPVVMTVHDFKIVSPNHSLYLNGKFYDRCRDGRFYQCFLDKCVKDSYLKSFLATIEMYWHEKFGTYKKNVDAFIVPSEFVKKILTERGIDEGKISVMPHFISKGNDFNTDGRSANKNEPHALYIGAISKSKGVDELIDIFRNIDKGKLFLAGNIEDDIVLKGIPNVKYLGFLNKSMLSDAIQKADCIISSSRLPETFGLVALESLSYGKPFFGFDSGAYSEIIQNGKNGFLSKDKEELKNLLNDFFQNKIVFDKEKIQKEAEQKYEKRAYLGKLEKLFRKVSGY